MCRVRIGMSLSVQCRCGGLGAAPMLSRFVEGKGYGAFYDTLHYAGNYENLYSNHLNSCTLPHYIRNVREHLLENVCFSLPLLCYIFFNF